MYKKMKLVCLLVDSSGHVLNVFGLVLQATVIMVGLHTGLNLTADGGTKLSTESAFLEEDYR